MRMYRGRLPQLGSEIFVDDGGIETTSNFENELELPRLSAFNLLGTESGTDYLRWYFSSYAEFSSKEEVGLILESPTWRASKDWAKRLGYSEAELVSLNRRSIQLMEGVRERFSQSSKYIVISGCVGPRADHYEAGKHDVLAAQAYHIDQIATFRDTAADMITATSMTSITEALGVVLAARASKMPVAVSLDVEADGRLPSGESIELAIKVIDFASEGYTSYFMVNCAHLASFAVQLPRNTNVLARLRGVRANSSLYSHGGLLTESAMIDDGSPKVFGENFRRLKKVMPGLTIVGGCCDTDFRHIQQACRALAKA